MKKISILALAATLALLPILASAQPSATGSAAKKLTLMQRLHAKIGHRPMPRPATGAVTTAVGHHRILSTVNKSPSNLAAPVGAIIGNSSTKVYHLPGDKSLPAPKNRVYFKSAAAARAAGYRPSGSGGAHSHMAKKSR